MKITVKKLQGGECTLEVLPSTTILEIKRQIANKLGNPVEEQKLLLLGRTLADDQTVESYPTMKDGAKLNLIVKKPEGLHEVSIKYFKRLGMSDSEAVNAANRLMRIVQEKFNKLSWDDIERLSMDCLADEKASSQPRTQVNAGTDCEDLPSL